MYDTILVPTDGSEGAAGAAGHARSLATAFDSEVHLLSVVDERAYSNVLVDLDAESVRDALESRADEAVADLADRVTDAGVPCHTAVEHGIPNEAITAYADAHDVDLVAMGTHGRTGLDRVLLGSVAERVVRTSAVPVLTCRSGPAEGAGYDDVLVATDGSEQAAAALDHAVAMAERYDATVHALSVVDVGALGGAYDLGAGVPSVLEALSEVCEDAVADVAERCDDRSVDVVTRVAQGVPHRVIREYVEDEGIDLVTMGTHGRTGLQRYLVGSVAERVVRTSEVPVLTTR